MFLPRTKIKDGLPILASSMHRRRSQKKQLDILIHLATKKKDKETHTIDVHHMRIHDPRSHRARINAWLLHTPVSGCLPAKQSGGVQIVQKPLRTFSSTSIVERTFKVTRLVPDRVGQGHGRNGLLPVALYTKLWQAEKTEAPCAIRSEIARRQRR